MLNRQATASVAVLVLHGRLKMGQTDGQTPDRCIMLTAADMVSTTSQFHPDDGTMICPTPMAGRDAISVLSSG